eukprot:3280841-Prymnesium_polylepis.1
MAWNMRVGGGISRGRMCMWRGGVCDDRGSRSIRVHVRLWVLSPHPMRDDTDDRIVVVHRAKPRV